jgi:hypothetical protein
MNKLRILLGTTLSVSMVMMSPLAVFAIAESGTGDNSNTNSTQKVKTTSTDASSATETKTQKPEDVAKNAADLKKRLDENKATLKTKLDDAAKKRISGKCKASQTVVTVAETRAGEISENRSKAYSKISEKIQTLIVKVKAQNIDTTALEAANAAAKQKAETLAASMAAYKLTLTDLRQMDCVTDPTGFQATLEKARTQRETVKTQAQELRTYIDTVLKNEIKAIRLKLDPKSTAGSNQNSDTNTTQTGGTR